MASASPLELLERLRASASAVSQVAESISPEKAAENDEDLKKHVAADSLPAEAAPGQAVAVSPGAPAKLETVEAAAEAMAEAEAMAAAEAEENEAMRSLFPPESFETPDRPTKRRRRRLSEAPKKKPAGAEA